MTEQVTPEMVHHWLQHPVTQRFREDLEGVRRQMVNRLIDFDRPCEVEETAKHKGVIQGIDILLEWKG
jgi:hypothetical protein